MNFPAYFNIAKTENDLNISIMGDIGQSFFSDGFTAENLQSILNDNKGVNSINVDINSLGGSLYDGIAIHEMLRNHPARVTTNCIGYVASAATLIAQAGDVRNITENSMYLIHQPMTAVFGNATEMQQTADTLDKMTNQLIDLYKKRSGMNRATIKNLINENNGNGKWLTATEAKDFALVDCVTKPDAAKNLANFTKEMFNNYKLPEMSKENENGLFAEIKAMFNSLTEKINGIEKKPVENTELADFKNQLLEFDNKLQAAILENSEVKAENEGLKNEITNLNLVNETFKSEVADLTQKLVAKTKVGSSAGLENNEGLPEGLTASLSNDLQAIRNDWNLVGKETKGSGNNKND